MLIMKIVSMATQDKLNDLVSFTFKQNSIADNAVYFLEFKKLENIAEILHHTYAHAFGTLADEITDFAKTQDIRIYRKGFSGDTKDFEDLTEVFGELLERFEEYQELILEAIEVAENNGDIDVKSFLEDYSLRMGKYYNQLRIWVVKAEQYGNNYGPFEASFSSFVHLPIID